MKLVTTEIPALLVALRAGYFRRAGMRVRVAGSPLGLLAEVRAGTDVIVLDLRQRWQRRTIASLRAIAPQSLLLACAPDARAPEPHLFDGVFAAEDLVRALVHLLARHTPPRRHRRRHNSLCVQLTDDDGTVQHGRAVNLGDGGAAIVVQRRCSRLVDLRFSRVNRRPLSVRALSVWSSPAADTLRAGFRFFLDDAEARRLRELALWDIVERGGERVLRLHGEIGGVSDLDCTREALVAIDVLDLAASVCVDDVAAQHLAHLIMSVAGERSLRLRAVPAALASLIIHDTRAGRLTPSPRGHARSRAKPTSDETTLPDSVKPVFRPMYTFMTASRLPTIQPTIRAFAVISAVAGGVAVALGGAPDIGRLNVITSGGEPSVADSARRRKHASRCARWARHPLRRRHPLTWNELPAAIGETLPMRR